MYDPTSTEELGKWRQRMRDNRAESLREYRRYKRRWGTADAISLFHFGMAGGYNVALIHIDHLVRCAEAKEILGYEDIGIRKDYRYPCQVTNAYYPAEDVATAVFISEHPEEESWGIYLVGGDALAVLVNIDIDHANGED